MIFAKKRKEKRKERNDNEAPAVSCSAG